MMEINLINMNKIIAISAVLFVGIVGLGIYVNSTKEPVVPVDAAEVFEIQADDHVSGDRNADVVIFEYLDLQCPACAAYHPVVDIVKEGNPDIAIVTRHFPLYFHRNARAAAQSAEAAAQQGQFDAITGLMFENQTVWSGMTAGAAQNLFDSYAQGLGLDMDAYNAYKVSDEAVAKVTRDYDGGIAVGVNSTPTFMMDGQRITPRSVEDFNALIAEAKSKMMEKAEAQTADTQEAGAL